MEYDPPFLETYKTLLRKSCGEETKDEDLTSMVENYELPLIDLARLNMDQPEREECMKEITEAAGKWGFFQVVNHGIPQELLEKMQKVQLEIFHQPFARKSGGNFMNLSARSYRWGNSAATNLMQLSWSEAFHISLSDISRMDLQQQKTLRSTTEVFATKVAALAQSLAEILALKLNIESNYFRENCFPDSSYLRLNRYPACPFPSEVFGLLPHSDSSFLTIVYQDQVGGLQLLKDGKWVGVKPNPQALIVNVGDLFQVLSNDIYKSIKHRVTAAEKVERFSVAYFYCPSNDAIIQSYGNPAVYKKFTYLEFRKQTEKDVKETGNKVGISRFLL